ncbi:hypothetical protein HK405_004185 [Cladochytrium tenue]|nr:hypothetical protein HK405_004185 [Cladochytrium tenue]
MGSGGVLAAAVTPGFILEQRDSWMFPVQWHQRFNYLWIAQSTLLLLYALRARRWVPTWGQSYRPWPVRQFGLLAWTHAHFYLVEMANTSLWSKYTVMWLHHFFAIIIFLAAYLDINFVSVVSVLPFVLHGYFWIRGAGDYTFLAFYNVVLLSSGVVGLHNNLVCGPLAPMGSLLPLLVVSLFWTNYYTYCYYYHGTACLTNTGNFSKQTELIIICFAGAFTTIVITAAFARRVFLPLVCGLTQTLISRVTEQLPDDFAPHSPSSPLDVELQTMNSFSEGAPTKKSSAIDSSLLFSVRVPSFALPPRLAAGAILSRAHRDGIMPVWALDDRPTADSPEASAAPSDQNHSTPPTLLFVLAQAGWSPIAGPNRVASFTYFLLGHRSAATLATSLAYIKSFGGRLYKATSHALSRAPGSGPGSSGTGSWIPVATA